MRADGNLIHPARSQIFILKNEYSCDFQRFHETFGGRKFEGVFSTLPQFPIWYGVFYNLDQIDVEAVRLSSTRALMLTINVLCVP